MSDRLPPAPGPGAQWRRTRSGAELAYVGEVVFKRHAARIDPTDLAARLSVAAQNAAFVPPVTADLTFDSDGRATSVWPRVPVLDPDAATLPWAEAGRLLAQLHRSTPPDGLPMHGWPDRLSRARADAPPDLADLLDRLAAEVTCRQEPSLLVHGDWHLGQLGRWQDGWRLLDIDDVGLGDPAWDLARPAGFWAAGLLSDDQWHGFVDGYRGGNGPALPTAGDPWTTLELPARCAVVVAAIQALRDPETHSPHTAEALVAACRRMAQLSP